MMSRLIDQFHEPENCKIAAMETEHLARELRALANSLETNECPDEIFRRFREEEKAAQAHRKFHMTPAPCKMMKQNVCQTDNTDICHTDKRRIHGTGSKCPNSGNEQLGCECNKRNGLQDDCLKLCCKAKRHRQSLK